MAHQRLNSQIAVLVLIMTALGCSMLRPRRPPTWLLTLEIEAPEDERKAAVDQTVSVIKRRLDLAGVSNFEVKPQGDARVLVGLPDVPDRDRLKNLIIAGGKLELAHVVSPPSPAPVQTYNTQEEAIISLGGTQPSNRRVLEYQESDELSRGTQAKKKWVIVESPAVVSGNDLRNAEASRGPSKAADYQIIFSLRPAGAERLGAWTAANINEYLAIVFNDEVKSIAYIKSQIFDQGEISGSFTKESAEDLAHILNSGALPAPVKIVAESFIKQP